MKEEELFFNKVMGKKSSQNNAIQVYQELVYHRFYEVLSNAYPIFHSLLKPRKFEKLVKSFMLYGAKTEFIWQMPNEFRRFLQKEQKLLKKMPFLKNLLWFEWIEIELFMQDYDEFEKTVFDFKNRFILSQSARIKKLEYDLIKREFKKKKINYFLAFYGIRKKEVCYKQISKFMYQYIKLLQKNSAKKALTLLCEQYKIKPNEIEKELKHALTELCNLGILQKG